MSDWNSIEGDYINEIECNGKSENEWDNKNHEEWCGKDAEESNGYEISNININYYVNSELEALLTLLWRWWGTSLIWKMGQILSQGHSGRNALLITHDVIMLPVTWRY